MQIEFEIEYHVNAGNTIGEDGSEGEATHGFISEHPEQEGMKGNSSNDLALDLVLFVIVCSTFVAWIRNHTILFVTWSRDALKNSKPSGNCEMSYVGIYMDQGAQNRRQGRVQFPTSIIFRAS